MHLPHWYISKIRNSLDIDSCKTLVNATVTSHLDYCNSLLIGNTDKLIQKLEKVQNMAARLIERCPKYDHISPVLHRLHWLPIPARIEYKILVYVFKALNNLAPDYISDLVNTYKPRRRLRSDNLNTLEVMKSRTETYGDRRFDVTGPKLWNSLPLHLRQTTELNTFKRGLKTHLFRKHL